MLGTRSEASHAAIPSRKPWNVGRCSGAIMCSLNGPTITSTSLPRWRNNLDQSLECGPLHRLVQSDPIEMNGLTARSRPGTMPGALRPALGIVLQLTWHFQRENRGRGLPRRHICLQRPGGNALLIEIRILQMADPGGEGDMSLDQHAEALGGIGPIG